MPKPQIIVTFVEGLMDKLLYTELGFPKVIVKDNKGQVFNKIEKIPNASKGIAIVDNDFASRQPKRLENYIEVLPAKHGIRFFKHKEKVIWCIIIVPDIENWIFNQLPQKDIKADTKLKYKTAKELKGDSKNVNVKNNRNVNYLIEKLITSNCKGIIQLKEHLEEIKTA